MAIAEKLQNIINEKTSQTTMTNYGLPSEEQINANTKFIDYPKYIFKAFIESLNNPNTLWSNLPKVNGEGKKITLNNTIEAPMKLELNPSELEQETTTGKNIFDELPDQSKTGITISQDKKSISVDFTASNDMYFFIMRNFENPTTKDYTVAFEGSGLSTGETLYYTLWGAGTLFSYKNGRNVAVIPSGTSLNQSAILFDDQGRSQYPVSSTVTFTNIMIVEGSYTEQTMPDYEPYTGGIASPNPDYPQQIHTISGDNEIVVSNKNLINMEENVVKREAANYTNINKTKNSLSYSIVGSTSGYMGYVIPIKIGQQYTLSYNIIQGYVNCIELDNNITEVGTNYGSYRQSGYSFTATKPYFGIWLIASNGTENSASISNLMLEKGSTPTSYVEHKEQVKEINLGDIEYCEIGDYKDKFIRNSGKNLLDLSTLVQGYYQTAGEHPLDGTTDGRYRSFTMYLTQGTYTINFDKYCNSVRAFTNYDYSTGTVLTNYYNEKSGTFTLTQNGTVYISFRKYDNTNWDDETDLVWLVKGATALPYEPYGKDQWYIKKNIGKVVLDGSETWSYSSQTNSVFYSTNAITGFAKSDNTPYSTHYRGKSNVANAATASSYGGDGSILFTNNPSNDYLYIVDNNYTDATNFKTWLSTHNTIVYYVLATPTYTLLNDTLQEQLNDIYNTMKSYNGQTNISQVNDDLGFNISSSAIEDIIG